MTTVDLPGYTLGRRLGGGPICDVYLATNPNGKTVAVKCLKPAAERDPLAILLIRREARAGMTCAHPHLIRLHDAHVAQSPYFLSLEFVGGSSVKRQLLEKRSIPVRDAFAIGRQVAEALAALHRAGLIHGDVKPANVLLPSPGQAKLIDLGFAHKPGELSPWIDRGNVIGTANYLAPEMTKLPPVDSPSADLFSLGVMLYELLTGTLPYPGRSTAEVVKHRRNCDSAILPEGNWPIGTRELIAKLTDPTPTRRPHARQLVQCLISLQIESLGRKAG